MSSNRTGRNPDNVIPAASEAALALAADPKVQEIPLYNIDSGRSAHRLPVSRSEFGYNNIKPGRKIPDFELYSSSGMKPAIGPLRSIPYRIGLTIRGGCDVQLGLEQYRHEPGTVNCTVPYQIFSKWNITADIWGYYLLFNPAFLEGLVPANDIPEVFPFFSYQGVCFWKLSPETIIQIEAYILKINEELHQGKTGHVQAIRMHLYLILLELKRSYQQQELGNYRHLPESTALLIRFRKLIHEHFLEKQQVSDYAEMLCITPNHLNRSIKESSGRTASSYITEMVIQEARALLRSTDLTVSEIAYRLRFSEPSSFNRFFRKEMKVTPLDYRAGSGQQLQNA